MSISKYDLSDIFHEQNIESAGKISKMGIFPKPLRNDLDNIKETLMLGKTTQWLRYRSTLRRTNMQISILFCIYSEINVCKTTVNVNNPCFVNCNGY